MGFLPQFLCCIWAKQHLHNRNSYWTLYKRLVLIIGVSIVAHLDPNSEYKSFVQRCRSVRMPWLSKVYSAFLTRMIVQVESALYEVLPTAHYLGSMIKNCPVWVTPNSTTAREFSNLMFFKQGLCNSRKEKRKGKKRKEKEESFQKYFWLNPPLSLNLNGVLFGVPYIDLLTLVFG